MPRDSRDIPHRGAATAATRRASTASGAHTMAHTMAHTDCKPERTTGTAGDAAGKRATRLQYPQRPTPTRQPRGHARKPQGASLARRRPLTASRSLSVGVGVGKLP